MEKLRLFIAVSLPAEIRQQLNAIRDRLIRNSRTPVKWVETQNMHLTLKFLGGVDAVRTEKILAAMEQAAAGTGAISLQMTGLGVFPNPRRVRVVWAGLGGETEKLAGLQRAVESSLEQLGFPAEDRKFQPHLTIGRVREQASAPEREELGRTIGDVALASSPAFKIDCIRLMKSTLTSSGPVYEEMGRVSLT